MQSIGQEIRKRLETEFLPQILEVIDESYLHAGHGGAIEGVSTHFRIRMTSKRFEGISRVERHKLVYAVLSQWMNNPIHALALELKDA